MSKIHIKETSFAHRKINLVLFHSSSFNIYKKVEILLRKEEEKDG